MSRPARRAAFGFALVLIAAACDGDEDEPAPSADGIGRRCDSPAAAPEIAVTAPSAHAISMEGALHPKQDKIAVTADGTVHVYVQYEPQGAAYVRSRDGGATWEAEQLLDVNGWLGVLVAGRDDDLFLIYASSWSENGQYTSSPMAAHATVDESSTPWTWTWDAPTPLLPNPPNPRHGFLAFTQDSTGVFHLVTASITAFSFDRPPDVPLQAGVHYFRSAPGDVRSFQLVDQLEDYEIWPVSVPGFALGYGADPAVTVDAADDVTIVYSDRSLYQSGLEAAEWPDAGYRGTIYLRRYLRTADGWEPTDPVIVARGGYGDVDVLTEPDGTSHVTYTLVDSGSRYRAAYRRVEADGAVGDEQLLTAAPTALDERTIFPSLARLDDGGLVVALTDRTTDPAGQLALLFRPGGAEAWSCAATLTTPAEGGSIDPNLSATEASGQLLLVYRTNGLAGEHFMRFGHIDASTLAAAFGL